MIRFELTEFLRLADQLENRQAHVNAESKLQERYAEDFPRFVFSLASELGDDVKPLASRKRAGNLLKSVVDFTKYTLRKDSIVQMWLNVDTSIRSQLKHQLLSTLGSSQQELRHISAQVIAKVAAIEIPHGQWLELVGSLLDMNIQISSAHIKQSTLQTLGYVCEELSPHGVVQDFVNSVLPFVAQSMASELPVEVRLEATKAMLNVLALSQANFSNENDRTAIMKIICSTAVTEERDIKQVAFECLVSIISKYYGHLDQYMGDPILLQVTVDAVKGDVALEAIEFWSSVCNAEIDRRESVSPEFRGSFPPPSSILKRALPQLIPLLLNTLEKREEDQVELSISVAGRRCLGLIAKAVGDDIVHVVTQFFANNISKPNWECREAATYALGSVLDGPRIDMLSPMVAFAMEFLLRGIKDENNNHVKEAIAWTLSRFFEFLHSIVCSITSPENLLLTVNLLLDLTKTGIDENVVEKVCEAIKYLAHGYRDSKVSSPLDLTNIIKQLVAAADGIDVATSKVKTAAYAALREVIFLLEDSNFIMQIFTHIKGTLEKTRTLIITSTEDAEKFCDLLASLCSVLQVVIQKLSGTKIIMDEADSLMVLFIWVLGWDGTNSNKEALLAASALAYATGATFEKHMVKLVEQLRLRLQSFEEYEVCSITIGVIGSLCRALDGKMLPYCDQIMSIFFEILRNGALHKSVIPQVLSCFGDIALAMGPDFEKYFNPVVEMIDNFAARCASMDVTCYRELVYVNQLRQGIITGYCGIYKGFKAKKNVTQSTELLYSNQLQKRVIDSYSEILHQG